MHRSGKPEPVLEKRVAEAVSPGVTTGADTIAYVSWANDISALSSILGYVARIVFFGIVPFFVVLFCVFASHRALTIMVVVTLLFGGLVGRTPQLTHKWPWLLQTPLLRDVLEVLNRLHGFYVGNRPQSFLFYLVYPISLPVFFIFSRTIRREFRLWAAILGSVLLALLVESAAAFSTIYPPHLGVVDALVSTTFRLGFCMFVFVGFFIPVTTTSFTYHLSGHPWWMRSLVVVGLLSAAPMLWVVYVNPSLPYSFWSQNLLQRRMQTPTFRVELRKSTEMFLVFHRSRSLGGDAGTVHPILTEEYRRHISGLVPKDEGKCFDVITVAEKPDRPWLGVRVYLINAPRMVAFVDPDGQFHGSWITLPAAIRDQFRVISAPSAAERREMNVVDAAKMIDDLSSSKQ